MEETAESQRTVGSALEICCKEAQYYEFFVVFIFSCTNSVQLFLQNPPLSHCLLYSIALEQCGCFIKSLYVYPCTISTTHHVWYLDYCLRPTCGKGKMTHNELTPGDRYSWYSESTLSLARNGTFVQVVLLFVLFLSGALPGYLTCVADGVPSNQFMGVLSAYPNDQLTCSPGGAPSSRVGRVLSVFALVICTPKKQ